MTLNDVRRGGDASSGVLCVAPSRGAETDAGAVPGIDNGLATTMRQGPLFGSRGLGGR